MAHRRLAAIDVGSNTVHLLVADARGGGLEEVRHEVVMPRIGRAVQATGAIGAEKTAEVCDHLRRMSADARADGAELLLVGATEAVRRAADSAAARAQFADAAGVACALIAPDAEARLSFRGALSAHPGEGLALVIDIGGGSTECVLGEPGRIDALVSVPMGSGAVTEQWLRSDPPTGGERTAAGAAIRAALAALPDGRPHRAIATGGTATTLPALVGRAQGSAGGTLGGDDLAACRHHLARHPSAEVAERFGIEPARARVLPGGVEILAAIAEHYALRGIAVSHQGLRDGMLLAWLERGERWVDG